MKYTPAIITLLTIITIQAFAIKPANSKTATSSTIPPTSQTPYPQSQCGQSLDETTSDEEFYSPIINEIELGKYNDTSCEGWSSSITNSGTIATTSKMTIIPSITYHPDENGQIRDDLKMKEIEIDALGPGETRYIDGFVNRTYPGTKEIVLSLKNGTKIVSKKTLTLKAEPDYSVSIEDSELTANQFTFTIKNNRDDYIPSLLIVLKGITTPQTNKTAQIATQTINCIQGKENREITFNNISNQKHAGYRIIIYRTGETSPLSTKDHLK